MNVNEYEEPLEHRLLALEEEYRNLGETALQKAMWKFEYEQRYELLTKHGIVDGRDISCLVDALIDVRNAKKTIQKASRTKDIRPSYLAHLKSQLRRSEEKMYDCAADCVSREEEATPEERDRYIKIAEKILRKMVKFIREMVPELFVDADSEFAHDQMVNNSGCLVSSMCSVICYDPAVPSKIMKLFSEDGADLRKIPYTSTARNISKYVYER